MPARDSAELTYCDVLNEAQVPRSAFKRPRATRFVVASLRPMCERREDIDLGHEIANRVDGVLRDQLIQVAGDGDPAEVEKLRQTIEVYRLRCVVRDESDAHEVGRTMGADLVLWGQTGCPIRTPRGAPLVEFTVRQEISPRDNALVHVQGGVSANTHPSAEFVSKVKELEEGTFCFHAALTSASVAEFGAQADRFIDASEGRKPSLDLPQVVGGKAYGLVAFVAGLHFYRQSSYQRALRYFRLTSEHLRADSRSAQGLLWIMGDTEMRVGRIEVAAGYFERGSLLTRVGERAWWAHRIARVKALTLTAQTKQANTLADEILRQLAGVKRDGHPVVNALRVDGPEHEALVEMAYAMNNLSLRLSELGRREDALAAIQGAVDVHQRLAAARPEAFEPDLAMSLNNLSNNLSALGRREDALAAIQGAVEIRRRLAAARPEAFEPDLASSLNNLSLRLSELGRREDALAAIQGAVEIRRRLAAARPEAFEPDLAGSLNNLSNCLSESGRREDALAAIQGAVDVYQRLAAARPGAFEPDLAMSLNNLSLRLSALGRREDALAAIEGAVEIRRRLAKARSQIFEPDLVKSLKVLAQVLRSLDRASEADHADQEAQQMRSGR